MTQSDAEILGIQALGWLAADPDRMSRFLALSGVETAALAALAREPAFLLGVLDFLLADEPTLLGFCADHNLPDNAPIQARLALPGGAEVHWT